MSDVLGDKDVIARLRAQRFELNKLSVIEYMESYFSTKGVGHVRALQNFTKTNADGGQTTTPTLYDSALLRARDMSHPLFSSDGILSYNNWSSGFRDNSLPTIVVVVTTTTTTTTTTTKKLSVQRRWQNGEAFVGFK